MAAEVVWEAVVEAGTGADRVAAARATVAVAEGRTAGRTGTSGLDNSGR